MNLSEMFEAEEKEVRCVGLIDFYGIMWASYHVSKSSGSFTIDGIEDLKKVWRYLILSMILKVKTEINPDEIVLCSDNKSWRKQAFKYYKANRVFKEEGIDKEQFFAIVQDFLEEYRNYFPYKVVQVEFAEADDVIAVLSEKFTSERKHVWIVSRDKDFKQLLKNDLISIYNPIDEKYVKCDDPHLYLMEHVLTGDRGDGIPNLLSEDNIFLQDGKRQKSITKKIKEQVIEMGLDDLAKEYDVEENLERNRKLIILESGNIPVDIVDKILYTYNNHPKPINDHMKVMQFLASRNIKSLYDYANDFLV